MPERLPCRPLRTGVFTMVCAGLSALGHAVGSGHGIPLPGLLLGVAVVAAAAWTASAKRQGPWMLAAWMLWGQLTLHLAFSFTQSLGSGHLAHQGAPPPEGGVPGWTMIAMHVVAAAISAWWLHLGENRLFAFLRFMALSFFALLLLPGAAPAWRETVAPRRPAEDERSWLPPPYLRHVHVRRGPPRPRAA
ncbi:hypothetical protein ACFO4E_11180 [Nocardiopsis mangrovi]|uniref:MFS transporter n=1 Tax=Nocardiopsis mangrovi TaxID=1179818 RepID=A0ABV9DUM5_9ACTN